MEIPENKYLGTLCKRGHDYEGTGKSLRFKGWRDCVLCAKTRRKRDQEQCPQRVRGYGKRYRERQLKNNPLYRPTRNMQERITQDRQREVLADSYIKSVISSNIYYHYSTILSWRDIPTGLIKLQRASLQLHRTIKEMQNV